ncbi:hypothetical protein V5O48_003151 [Marasmius crinis-equi]|uniref:Uncharacterized protein n=1 Tax=Marasmius crinis-equi TaxID=585013 RepID=A0ABR3FTM6_9AGAR
MPSVAQRITRSKTAQAAEESKKKNLKLRPATPEDIYTLGDPVESDSTSDEYFPEHLDDIWPYTFQAGESVWVKTAGGNWVRGKVTSDITRKGATREKEGLYYPVKYDTKFRKYFSPLNGEIKPDTLHTRRLLERDGYGDEL